jgi:general stress protein 26
MDIDAYNKILSYVDKNPIATLGTVDLDGVPHGAAVYVCADDYRRVVYCLTKTETQKYKNIKNNSNVSLTVVNPAENSTLQATGRAFDVTDAKLTDVVMKKINRVHASAPEWLPPLAKINAGVYTLVGIELAHARLAQFKDRAIGDIDIFTEM